MQEFKCCSLSCRAIELNVRQSSDKKTNIINFVKCYDTH